MTFDELPLELTSFLERESWVFASASALYFDRDALWTATDRRLTNFAMAADCAILRIPDGPLAAYVICLDEVTA